MAYLKNNRIILISIGISIILHALILMADIIHPDLNKQGQMLVINLYAEQNEPAEADKKEKPEKLQDRQQTIRDNAQDLAPVQEDQDKKLAQGTHAVQFDQQKQNVASNENYSVNEDTNVRAESVNVPEDNPLTQEIMQAVKSKISPYWHKAQPPSIGEVDIEIVINLQGNIDSLWITRLQGPAELGDFVKSLLYQAAPFKKAVKHIKEPMVLDFGFIVVGGGG